MARVVEFRWRAIAIVALNAMVLGLLIGLAVFPRARDELFGIGPMTGRRQQESGGVGSALVGGPFALVSQSGAVVSDRDFRGRVMIVAFGYADEPDLTPATLQTIVAALAQLGTKADRIAPLFISLDPAHDTPARLRKFLADFDPRLIGLTGSAETIAAVAKAYRLPVAFDSGALPSPHAQIAYEPLIFLMNPRGEYVAHLSHDKGVADLVAAIRLLL